jgi:hypothetical protein
MEVRTQPSMMEPVADSESLPTGKPNAPRSSRWRSWLLLLFCLAVATVLWLSPRLAARWLTARGMRWRDGELSCRLEVSTAILDWRRPVELHGVRLLDSQGMRLLDIPTVSSERSLWALVVSPRRPGRFFVQEPHVQVVVRETGSNLADVCGVLFSGEGEPLHDVQVSVASAVVTVATADGDLLSRVEDLNLTAADRRTDHLVGGRTLSCEASGVAVAGDGRQPLEAAFEWSGPWEADPRAAGAGSAAITITRLPLANLAALLASKMPGLRVQSGEVSGEVLVDWNHDQPSGAAVAPPDHVTGRVTLTGVHAEYDSADGDPQVVQWDREELMVDAVARYDRSSDVLTLEQVSFDSTPVALSAAGEIRELTGACRFDLAGDLEYDLAALIEHLPPEWREHVTIEGLRTERFAVTGPLLATIDRTAGSAVANPPAAERSLSVVADLRWDRAELLGVETQSALLTARLAPDELQLAPQEVAVSSGRWLRGARVPLDESPVAVVLESGEWLENVRFTPEMCQLWLKFVSPALAEATHIDGRFSLSVEQGRIPVDQPTAGRIAGRLDVQSASVRPGPLAQEIITLVATIEGLLAGRPPVAAGALQEPLLELPEQGIEYALHDGRVHHSGMVMVVRSAQIRTSGSVGLDESLDLVLEIPVQDRWLRSELLESAFRGEVLRIPVRGTLRRPVIDRQILSDLVRRLAQRATGGLLRKLLD